VRVPLPSRIEIRGAQGVRIAAHLVGVLKFVGSPSGGRVEIVGAHLVGVFKFVGVPSGGRVGH